MNKPRKLRAELEYRVTRAALKKYMETLSESIKELDARAWPTTETDVEVPAITIVHAAAANTTIVQCRSSWW
jgi:hypothetical protein